MRLWDIKDKGTETSFKTTIAPDIIRLTDCFEKQGLLTWVGDRCCFSPINQPAFIPGKKGAIHIAYIKHLKYFLYRQFQCWKIKENIFIEM